MELQDIKSMQKYKSRLQMINCLNSVRYRYISGCIAAQNRLTKCQMYQKSCVSN